MFTKNRDRPLAADVSQKFLQALPSQPKVKALLSEEHFSVDGTLLEPWASMKSFVPKDGSGEPPAGGGGNAERDFHGEKRGNDTLASTTDPDCRLYRKGKGKESKLRHMGHALMENRHGLVVDATVTTATAEREAAVEMITSILPAGQDGATAPATADAPRVTLGADKGYDAADFIDDLTGLNVDPRHQPTHPQADRGGVRLDEDGPSHPQSLRSLRTGTLATALDESQGEAPARSRWSLSYRAKRHRP